MGIILQIIRYYFSIIFWKTQSKERIKRMQLRRFKEIFEYAREKCPFYREIYTKAGVLDLDIKTWDDVEKIPIVDKELMRKYSFDMLTTCDTNSKNVVTCYTSGSTGEPFRLAYSKFANTAAYFRVLYVMLKVAKYNPLKKITLLSKYDYNDKFKVENNISILKKVQDYFGLFKRDIISIFESPRVIVYKLLESKPYILYSSSSAVELAANYVIENKIKIHIPYIFLIAEPLSDEQYNKFKNCFNANVIDIYGAKESPSLGYEINKNGYYRLFPNSNIFEFIDIHSTEVGEKGTVVVTNIINKVQPFVRYNLKDYADINNDYEFGITKLGHIMGRISDILTFPDGTKLFHYCISQLYIDFNYAQRYKFLQIGNGPIEMHIVPNKDVDRDIIIEDALKRWKKKYNHYDLIVKIVDNLPIDSKTGKFKVIEHKHNTNEESVIINR